MQVFAGRLGVIFVILFAAVFALDTAKIVDQLAALSSAGLLVTVPPIIGAFFWRRGTAAGVLACLAGGSVVAVVMALGLGVSVFNPALSLTVAAVSTGLFVAVSLISQPRVGALDFAGELRADLDRHNAW
jgi:SSS family solute:Na+ symporter